MALDGKERRRFVRKKLPLDIYVAVNNKLLLWDTSFNFSERGACFQLPIMFSKNDFLYFSFAGKAYSPLEGIKFTILGTIVWVSNEETKKNRYLYGTEFMLDDNNFASYDSMSDLFNRLTLNQSFTTV
ncbi:MAG: PilZ domain-containing protein [Chitinispirillia bacterium]|jgi:hypothetical protein